MTERKYISQYDRFKVLKRQNFRCKCGKKLKYRTSQQLIFDNGAVVGHVDHIIPLARGGANELRNYEALCPECNLRKGAKMPELIQESQMTELDILNEIDKLKLLIAIAKENLNAYNIDTVKHWDILRTRLELFIPDKRRVEKDEELENM